MTREDLGKHLERMRARYHKTGATAEEIAKGIFREAKAKRSNLDPGEHVTDQEIKEYLSQDPVIKKSGMILDDLIHCEDPP
jgi:hypothetical protein